MKIAIFGKHIAPEQYQFLQIVLDELAANQADICFFKPFFDKVSVGINMAAKPSFFNTSSDLLKNTEMLFSIGGDGTILDAVPYVRGSGIPILGINLGKLGFLSSVSKNEIKQAIDFVIKGKYTLDKRSLIRLEKPTGVFGDLNFALNDLTIYRSNVASLISVQVYVDDVFLNTYWGDGLIVSTPTGSTAYSLSAGGPIIAPGSRNFVIVPIASHNLTVRPIVIQDSSQIRIKFDGREEQYFLTMDSRQTAVNKRDELIINRCEFEVKLVQLENKDFFNTIRDKLLWGKDLRN
ncbi:MAG TPA: NAD kinase [Bacteroidales bacterium]